MSESRLMRQQDINYQHAVCNAYFPQLEHLRPSKPPKKIVINNGSEGRLNMLDTPRLMSQPKPPPAPSLPYPKPKCMAEAMKNMSVKYGHPVDEIRSASRKKKYQKARIEFSKISRNDLKKTLNEIGIYLGDRDHTSIKHYLQQEIA